MLAFQVFVADAFNMRLDHNRFAWLKDRVDLHNTLIEGRLWMFLLFMV